MSFINSFSDNYAKIYDSFHQSKDYKSEVQEIIKLLGEGYFDFRPKNVLDFGCGTGLHLEQFEKLGFRVSGFDTSISMLDIARKRVPSGNFYPELTDVPENFGLTLSLFDVISYQTTWDQLEDVFQGFNSKTSSDAFIVVDSWQLEGVLLDPPQLSKRSATVGGIVYSREVSPIQVLSPSDSRRVVIYELLVKVADETNHQLVAEEIHKIRAWSVQDLEKIAQEVGLEVVRTFNPKNFIESKNSDWRFGAILRKPS